MTAPSDEELAAFVAASAAMLDLKLDDGALAAVTEAMRGVAAQAALVVAYRPKGAAG